MALSLFAQAFGGDWHCIGATVATRTRPAMTFSSRWRIESAPGTNWTVVQWGTPGPRGGTAYVGYVPALKAWIYEDFHGDGSFARSHSSGPVGDAWTWFGTYYAGTKVIAGGGPIVWRRVSATRFERTYTRIVNGVVTKTGSDYCTR